MAHLAHHPAPRRMQKGGQPEAEREHWLEERLFGRAPRTAPDAGNQPAVDGNNQKTRIPLSHTTYHTSPKTIQKRPNTGMIPVNLEH